MKNFFAEFVDWMETYADKVVMQDKEYRELLHECAVLSEKEDKKAEYKKISAELDWLYRRCLVEAVMKCTIRIMVETGVL